MSTCISDTQTNKYIFQGKMPPMGGSPKWYGKGHRKLTCSSAGFWSWRVLHGLHLRCQSSLPSFSCFSSHLPSFTSGVYPESTSWPSVSGFHICIIVKLYSLHGWSLWHDRALVFLFKVNLGSQRQRKEIWLIVRILKFLLAEKSW